MTAQDLKNSILQLAVQGKLVSQNPTDEPASELLKRIADERIRRMDAGTLVVDKKHTAAPITADDIPYDVPENWKWARFADIVTFNAGKTPQRQNTGYWSNGEYPWVSIADMQADSITTSTKESISKTAFDDSFSGKISPAGSMIMSFKLTIGKVSVLGMDAVHNEAIISICPTAPVEDSRILQKWLFKIMPLVAATGNSKNAIKGKTLNATSISNLMIPVPPLAEQERIVAKIEELLPFVSEYDEAEKRLTALNAEISVKLRKSILQQAIQGKLTERNASDKFASELLKRIFEEKTKLIIEGKVKKEKTLSPIGEDEIPFDIPDKWQWVRFSELMHGISTGPFGSMLHKEDYVPEGIPVVNPANIINSEIIPLQSMMISEVTAQRLSSYRLTTGMIVMGRRGEMGRCAIVGEAENGWLCGTGSFFMTPSPCVYSPYLILFFASPYAKSYLGGASIGETMNNLNHNILKAIPVPLPPFAEQQRVVKRVGELLAVCDMLK